MRKRTKYHVPGTKQTSTDYQVLGANNQNKDKKSCAAAHDFFCNSTALISTLCSQFFLGTWHLVLGTSMVRGTRCEVRSQRGFILPTMLLFILFVTVSGASYLHLRDTEYRLALGRTANFSAFELANAGIERARATYNISFVGGTPSWTPVLQGAVAEYPTDTSPDPNLCPDTARGCVIPSFQNSAINPVIPADGDPVTAPDLPFGETFVEGSYTVRAYNNIEDPVLCPGPATTDCDGVLIYRAVGNSRGQQKLIEIQNVNISDMGLLNCQGNPDDDCPEGSTPGDPQLVPMDGREPRTSSELPTLSTPGLTNPPTGYYSPTGGFAALNYVQATGDIVLTAAPDPTKPEEFLITDNTFYYTDGSIVVKDSGGPGVPVNNLVVFGWVDVQVKTAILNNTVVIAGNEVRLTGGATISAPLPHPAVITTGSVQADNNVTITGNLYSSGDVDLLPIQFEGILIGGDIHIQGSSTFITDNGDPVYYQFMPGFDYPGTNQVGQQVAGSWQEVQ